MARNGEGEGGVGGRGGVDTCLYALSAEYVHLLDMFLVRLAAVNKKYIMEIVHPDNFFRNLFL